MKRRSATEKKEALGAPEINLTALIDVVFVILIMFILVAPLLELEQVELADGPKDSKSLAALQESGPIQIHVNKDNAIFYNHALVSEQELQNRLKTDKALYPSAHPQLFHDKRGSFGVYQSVKNAAESAGFDQLDIVLSPS